MGMPKRFAVFGVGSFRVSGQNKADTSLKWTKFLVPKCPLSAGSTVS